MRWVAVSVVATAVLVVGCVPTPSGSLTTPTPAVRDCGREDSEHGANLNAEARRCFLTAYLSNERAMFVSTAVTIEGAPIGRTYRSLGDGAVDVFHDARRDPLGSGKIEQVRCARLVAVEDWNAVTGQDRPLDEVFVEDQCESLGTQ